MVDPERIELPPLGSRPSMISISPKAGLVLSTRIELVFHPYQGCVMPLYYESKKPTKVGLELCINAV
jgi:hypothetical protein